MTAPKIRRQLRWVLARQNGWNPTSFRIRGVFEIRKEALDYKREHGMHSYRPVKVFLTEPR